MKTNQANQAPEKLYVDVHDNLSDPFLYGFTEKRTNDDIVYIRTDAFIEKACAWLKNHYRDYMYNPTGKRLEAFFGGDMCNDFEDYLKK